MNDNAKVKSKRRQMLEMIYKILEEQFVNKKPNIEKIDKYIDENYVESHFIPA